jgi:SOS-response transcriptional repressor LexA
MNKLFEKLKIKSKPVRLDPLNPAQRKQMIEQAVKRTIQEYGEALKKLGAE